MTDHEHDRRDLEILRRRDAGQSHAAIGRALGMSEGAVKKTVARIRKAEAQHG